MSINIPRQLQPERNQIFRDLYFKHYGMELSREEADEEAHRFLSFCSIIVEQNPEYLKDIDPTKKTVYTSAVVRNDTY